ncbi:probable 3-deoxy-manno-octulosonate cytidylyltransferase (CMP KDO transferase) protein [Fulvimarina pelagi HTCC2506]|uniref:Probable 3-deoxy-manno-octulosonate cytidylyltransferase (CMP KDO transferase) protein n=1 Tax=Fulvimarina pelagi HTCC2506 TaxID=314231 RepID=Q0G7J3_9HYPH|nr:hypothetical protein [Fulvimarina pelagi]EAU42371.1 probable 3-deoxy-manno-octulosonate cytidylyltransferase (CMP KDO transferase) protein [Fulvimarina pelagi HTCC2506]
MAQRMVRDDAPGPEEWRKALALFSGYKRIALVANSEALNIGDVEAANSADTLFVFFTRCPRVLKRPFSRASVLCHRMKDPERFNEGEKHVERARALFAPGALKGEVGIIAHDVPKSGAKPYSPVGQSNSVGHLLDLDSVFFPFYTPDMTPTTGFAMAIWLVENLPDAKVILCGFTGVRGPDFRMRTMHDWTLEQTVLRLLSRSGRLEQAFGGRSTNSTLDRLDRRFPKLSEADIALVAADVLSDRINAIDRLVSMLWSVSRAPRAIHRALAGLKPGAKRMGRDDDR